MAFFNTTIKTRYNRPFLQRTHSVYPHACWKKPEWAYPNETAMNIMVSIQRVSHQHADVNPLVFRNRTASLQIMGRRRKKTHAHREKKSGRWWRRRILRKVSRAERERANCLSRKINARRAFIASSEIEKWTGHVNIVGGEQHRGKSAVCFNRAQLQILQRESRRRSVPIAGWTRNAKRRKMVPTSESC